MRTLKLHSKAVGKGTIISRSDEKNIEGNDVLNCGLL